MKNHQTINYHSFIIMYEKETRTKANHSKHRTSDSIQYSYLIVIQQ
jgi:hypothetical protein